MILCQITDCHIADGRHLFGAIDTAGGLARAVERINGLDPAPDLVLVTGDLVNDGTAAQYRHFRSLVEALGRPIRVLPGNHDDRAEMRAAFGGTEALPVPAHTPFLHYVERHGPVRLIALDTLDPGKTPGLLCDDRLAWLEARLREDRQSPTLIAMHHPPFQTGMPMMDRYGLEGRARFEALIESAPNVQRIVAGHVHRTVAARVGHATAQIAPSTAHTLAWEIRSDRPPHWTDEPAGLLLHVWGPEQRFVTHHLLTQPPHLRPLG